METVDWLVFFALVEHITRQDMQPDEIYADMEDRAAELCGTWPEFVRLFRSE